MIIAFEGVDGAGKNTLVNAVEEELLAREIPVARLGFPRYEHSVAAQLVQRALYQRMGDLTDSIHGMATLFALDRHEVAEDLADLDADGYVILLDRYVASNAAYSVARSQDPQLADWVADLEFTQLGIPTPDLQVLVDVEAEVASSRAAARADQDSTRAKDSYESDQGLQARTVAAYRNLAKQQWHSSWQVVDFSGSDVASCAQQIADCIEADTDTDTDGTEG